MSKHKRARRAPKACPNTSIHPNGRDTAKAGVTTRPRRQRTVTEAHRRHVAEHPTDAMSGARLALLETGKA